MDDTTDWGAVYRANAEALSELAGSLTPEEIESRMPGTPEWTVRQIYAHLAGGPADSAAGRTEGAPGPEWTAVHVAERDGVPLPELVTELESYVDGVVASLADADFPGVVCDISTHHADLHEGLGRGALHDHFWRPVHDLLRPRRAADLPDTVPAYDVFRAMFSRRSRAQMRAWGTDLTDEQLDAMPVFGPRDDDQPAV